MADEWAPIDGPATSGPAGAPSSLPPPQTLPPRPPPGPDFAPPAWHSGVSRLVAAGATVLWVAVAVWSLLPVESDRTDERPDARRTGPDDPGQAVRAAAGRLEAAATFSFEGFVVRSDPGRPGPVAAVEFAGRIEGDVALPDRSRQRLTPETGDAVDRLVVGPRSWSRSSPEAEQLDDRPWVAGTAGEYVPDARSIVGWLADSTDHRDRPTDARGRRVIRATVPGRGPAGPTDGTLGVALNREGDPVQVTFSVTAPDDTILDLSYDLSGFGRPVRVEPPSTV